MFRSSLLEFQPSFSCCVCQCFNFTVVDIASSVENNAFDASFNSFLFGSIVAISDGELYTVAVVSGIIVLAFLFLYKELFYLALDERAARMSGIPVGIINSVFTVLIAVTVTIAARTVPRVEGNIPPFPFHCPRGPGRG